MILIYVLLILGSASFTPENNYDALAASYIEEYKELAIIEMHRSGVPASITLAQALIETNAGRSNLATKANNHFGIKCKRTWNGETYYHEDDDLDKNGDLIASCFRAYDSVIQSYADHSNFLRTKENYMQLFLLDRYDYKNWARGLKESGYATNPKYADMIISKIEAYGLDQYDKYPDPAAKFKK